MHINNIASARADSQYDSDESVMITRRNKAKTGVFCSNKSPRRAHDRHHGVHIYYVLCKKAGMPERKYALHIANYCTGVRTKRSIKDSMGGHIGSRNNAVQQYNKSENKWKKDLKYIKKKNKMLYSIAKKSISRR